MDDDKREEDLTTIENFILLGGSAQRAIAALKRVRADSKKLARMERALRRNLDRPNEDTKIAVGFQCAVKTMLELLKEPCQNQD